MATASTTATTAHMSAVSLHRLSKSFLCTLISRCANTREYFVVDEFCFFSLDVFSYFDIKSAMCGALIKAASSEQIFFFLFFFAFFLKSSLLPAFLIYLYEVYFLIHLFISSFLLLLPIHDERRFFFSLSFDIVCCCVCPLLPPCLFLCLWCLLHQCVKKYLSTRKAKWKSSERKYEKEEEKKTRWKVRRTQCVQCGNRISDFNYVFFSVVSIFILFFCIDFFLHRIVRSAVCKIVKWFVCLGHHFSTPYWRCPIVVHITNLLLLRTAWAKSLYTSTRYTVHFHFIFALARRSLSIDIAYMCAVYVCALRVFFLRSVGVKHRHSPSWEHIYSLIKVYWNMLKIV